MALVEVGETKNNYYIDSAQYFDEPGVLTVLAIPINDDECMFLPYPHALGRLLETGEEIKHNEERKENDDDVPVGEEDDTFAFGDAENKWQKKKGVKGWWEKRRRQRWDRESKTDKFLKRVPDNVENIRILFPTSIGIDNMQAQLSHQITRAQSRRSARVLGLTAALPFALLLDLLTFTFIFTISDIAMIVSQSRKMKKGKIVDELMASGHITFEENNVLDAFYKNVSETTHKMPDNVMIEELCRSLNCWELVKTIRKVRNSKAHKQRINRTVFELRDSFAHEQPKGKDAYATLDDHPPEYRDW
jgi:hypothetical protein